MSACEYCGGAMIHDGVVGMECLLCGRPPSTVYWVTTTVYGGGWRRSDARKHLVDKEKTGNLGVCGVQLEWQAIGRLEELAPCNMCAMILERRVKALAAKARKAAQA